jgi:hypothetical protein
MSTSETVANEASGIESDSLSRLCARAETYAQTLTAKRRELAPPEFWYPYGTISNFRIIDRLLTGDNRKLFEKLAPKRAVDIGGADGDVSFFLEEEGWEMTIVDNPPTSWNGLKGPKLHKEATGSKVAIQEVDLDAQFRLEGTYPLAIMLGIIYHLKNPFFALEQLSKSARYALFSTRITRWSGPASGGERQFLEHLPVAYLLGPAECNNDSTNYWIFSDAGFRRLLDRTHWEIRDYTIVGDTEEADPFTTEHDARAFCLAESRRPPV